MGSKAFVLLGVFAIVLLIISSEVAARDLLTAHTTSTDNKNAEEAGTTIGVDDAKYGGNGGYQGDHPGRGGNGGRGGYGGGHGGGGGGYGGGRGGGGGGGRCYYGCCRQSYYRRGCERCCNHAGEAVDAQPHN